MKSGFSRKVLRRLIASGAQPGFTGSVGRWIGSQGVWRMDCGARVILDNPAEYIQSQILEHGAYEPNIADLLTAALGPKRIFADVGGNIGCHTLVAASTGAHVQVFEPVPRIGERLLANVRLNGWLDRVQLFRGAAGGHVGKVIVNVALRDDDGSHSIIAGVEASAVEQIEVPLTTLDTHLLATEGAPIAVVKVDVEGYEARVLDGACKLIAAAHPPVWIIETGDRLADQIGESARSAIDRLAAGGYEFLLVPERGAVQWVVPGEVTGELANYCCVHPASLARDAVMAAAHRLGAKVAC